MSKISNCPACKREIRHLPVLGWYCSDCDVEWSLKDLGQKGPPYEYDKVNPTFLTHDLGDGAKVILSEDPAPCSNGGMTREERKWDKGKLDFTLILPGFEALMAEILTKGEINHPKEPDGTPSWQLVEPEAYLKALMRHVNKRRAGQLNDNEMGTNHWGHVAVNAMFLWWFDIKNLNSAPSLIKLMANMMEDENEKG